MKHWKTIIGIFIGLTIFGLFLPFLITQKPGFWDLGRADANEIGDTIGGILGPYFSFIGSCLVAYTIYLQIEQRRDDKQKEYDKTIFEEVKNEFIGIISEIENFKSLDNKMKSVQAFQEASFARYEINKDFNFDHVHFESISIRFFRTLNTLNLPFPEQTLYMILAFSYIKKIEFLFGISGFMSLYNDNEFREEFLNKLDFDVYKSSVKDFKLYFEVTSKLCNYIYESKLELDKEFYLKEKIHRTQIVRLLKSKFPNID